VAENAHRAEVMYAGRIVESAPVDELFRTPRHPYTAMLLGSHPSLAAPGRRLPPIPGRVPAPGNRPPGCRFRDRCPIVRKSWAEEEPEVIPAAGGGSERGAACPYGEEAERLWAPRRPASRSTASRRRIRAPRARPSTACRSRSATARRSA